MIDWIKLWTDFNAWFTDGDDTKNYIEPTWDEQKIKIAELVEQQIRGL